MTEVQRITQVQRMGCGAGSVYHTSYYIIVVLFLIIIILSTVILLDYTITIT